MLLTRSADRVIIIDPEGEYERVRQAFHGTRVDVSAGSEQRINPLDITLQGVDAGENPVKVVEVITAASGMSMAEAQACVDNTPSVVLRSVRADVGRQFARDVSMAGGTTILAPAESASSGHVPATSDAAVPDAVADLPADAVADLVLHAVGAQPVAVVKALYAHCGCDLKGAKDLADQAPVTVMEGASREAIASAYAALREAGAEVEVIIR